MNYGYLLLGALCLLLAVGDLLWTTLWVEGGAGPMTSRLMGRTWDTLRTVSGDHSRWLSVAGPAILIGSLVVWIALLWAGWTFLFAAAENALIDTRAAGPISWTERLYFVGYSVFTMGNGDFAPRDGLWQVVTALTTASGMLFVTLSVTYVLSVLGAVTQKRALASSISGLGPRSTEILATSWDGEEFRGLELPLNTISTRVNTLTSNHKAYPILHYFYTPDPDRAPTAAIAVFDEMLTLLQFGVSKRHRPSELAIRQARESVSTYLETLDTAFVQAADESPPVPAISAVRDGGVPTVPPEEFHDAMTTVDDRRRQLFGLLQSDERQWPR
ncbi:potassium channel family protein [Haloarcula onubensis]|uniref:Potassium channel family protein n=1 Tax=Haloarcula onubensis TaxID=2950539 RepID=A0ABU2FQW5_9EURY|nr:potassium channel family protein [Halomicroarcula sp. S3CR25-11]MDS0282677.1 potassium channel family protein [Halomicroarcula sp. S3CR25-11]